MNFTAMLHMLEEGEWVTRPGRVDFWYMQDRKVLCGGPSNLNGIPVTFVSEDLFADDYELYVPVEKAKADLNRQGYLELERRVRKCEESLGI